MKYLVLFAAFSIGVVCDTIPELQSQLPTCSIECIAKGAAAHDCAITDIACQCKKSEAITATVAPCLVKAGCELSDIADTATIVSKICEVEAKASGNDTSTTSGDEASDTATAVDATETSAAAGRIDTIGLLGIIGLSAAAIALL